MNGVLYLLATPIGNLTEINQRFISVLESVDLVACENPRNSVNILNHLNIKKKTVQINAVNEDKMSQTIINEILDGKNVAFMSDAGYPCVSDPGHVLVKLAISKQIEMHVVNGSSAFLTALVASGLDTSRFFFYGFLSSKSGSKKNELSSLKTLQNTLIFYESSHRIQDTLKIMYEVFGDRKVCVARELTKLYEEYIRGNLSSLQNLTPLQQKGEFVIIVEGASNVCHLSNEDLIALIEQKVSLGYKIKEACEIVSKDTNVSKNQLYNIYHEKS